MDERYATALRALHVDLEVPLAALVTRFSDDYAAVFGDERREDAVILASGPLGSTERERALWDLGRHLRADGNRLSQTFGPTKHQRELRAGVREFIERFGDSTGGWRQDIPTWREHPATLLPRLDEQARLSDAESPEARAQHRADLEAELAAVAATDPAARAVRDGLPEARQAAERLAGLALQCERLAAASRARWLVIGQRLSASGALADPSELFYLRRAELTTILEGGAPPDAAEIEQRREAHSRNAKLEPPPVLGAH